MTCLVAVQLVRTLPLETHLGTDEDPVTWQVYGCIEIIRMVGRGGILITGGGGGGVI